MKWVVLGVQAAGEEKQIQEISMVSAGIFLEAGREVEEVAQRNRFDLV